jgi:hypothetical protein
MPSEPEPTIMPAFTIETTYRLPVYRHRTYTADSLDEACRLAIADDDWWDQKHDYDNSGPICVSGAWLGEDAAYEGESLPVPAPFDEVLQVNADHFATFLGLLKTWGPAGDTAVAAAIAEAEAILAGAANPS